MKVSAANIALAIKIAEVSAVMTQDDIRKRLALVLSDQSETSGSWAYIQDILGDSKSGDVVYSMGGDLKKAPYTCSDSGAKIDFTAAVDVLPLTSYVVATAESLSEAGARNSKRDAAMLQTIHDHVSKLGANCAVKESGMIGAPGTLKLTESADWRENTLELIEAAGGGTEMEIKLIAPGKGSSAFYPKEVLERDGPKVFTKNTQIYINHATKTEESQRPEGDWHKLAGALASDAYWSESGKKGPGLYAKALFSSDYAALVREKAPFTGMSIRASGIAESGKMRDGVPILKELTGAESVDVVTRAGAGGMILTESAGSQTSNLTEGADQMDAAEIKKLQESSAATALALTESQKVIANLTARAVRGDARELAAAVLATTALTESQRIYVTESVCGTADSPRELPLKEGALDAVKFTEAVNAEAKRFAAALPPAGVRGLGAGLQRVAESAEVIAARETQAKESEDRSIRTLVEMGLTEAAAKESVKGRAA